MQGQEIMLHGSFHMAKQVLAKKEFSLCNCCADRSSVLKISSHASAVQDLNAPEDSVSVYSVNYQVRQVEFSSTSVFTQQT